MRMVLRIAVLPLIACAFSACQLQGPASATMPDVHEPDLVSVAAPATRNGPDWERAEDCPGKLFLLQQGLSDGSLIDLEGTPFTLIDHSLPSARSGWSPAQGSVDWGTVASSPLSEVRCIVRIGQAFDQQSEHQVIGREQVRSRYQSGA